MEYVLILVCVVIYLDVGDDLFGGVGDSVGSKVAASLLALLMDPPPSSIAYNVVLGFFFFLISQCLLFDVLHV